MSNKTNIVVFSRTAYFHYLPPERLVCLLFLLSLVFREQLKRSVNIGCPLQADYSLLNLLAAFSIILSYGVPPKLFPAPPLGETGRWQTDAETSGQQERQVDRQDPRTHPEVENGHLRIGDWIKPCQIVKAATFHIWLSPPSAPWPFWYLTPKPIYCQWTTLLL